MAGGENAAVVACVRCRGEGRIVKARRVREGLEDDGYVCVAGHEFAIDWSLDGPPSRPQWPPPTDPADPVDEVGDALD